MRDNVHRENRQSVKGEAFSNKRLILTLTAQQQFPALAANQQEHFPHHGVRVTFKVHCMVHFL